MLKAFTAGLCLFLMGSAPFSGSGGAASVQVSAPITGDGSAATPLGCTPASGAANGCLSSANWTTFNGKQQTVTIAVPVVATDANGLAIASGVLNLEIADATHPGSVSIAAQSFGGAKTFSNGMTVPAGQFVGLNGSTSDYGFLYQSAQAQYLQGGTTRFIFYDANTGTSKFTGAEGNGSGTAAFNVDTANTLSTAGDKLQQWSNHAVLKASVDLNGLVFADGGIVVNDKIVNTQGRGSGNQDYISLNATDLEIGYANSNARVYLLSGTSMRLSSGAGEGNQDSSQLALSGSGGNATLIGGGTAAAQTSTGRVVAGGSAVYQAQNHGVTVFSVYADGGYQPQPQVLDTCKASMEGTVEFDAASGLSTGHATRLCLCRSNGSATYVWQNLAGTSLADLGTATTCPD